MEKIVCWSLWRTVVWKGRKEEEEEGRAGGEEGGERRGDWLSRTCRTARCMDKKEPYRTLKERRRQKQVQDFALKKYSLKIDKKIFIIFFKKNPKKLTEITNQTNK